MQFPRNSTIAIKKINNLRRTARHFETEVEYSIRKTLNVYYVAQPLHMIPSFPNPVRIDHAFGLNYVREKKPKTGRRWSGPRFGYSSTVLLNVTFHTQTELPGSHRDPTSGLLQELVNSQSCTLECSRYRIAAAALVLYSPLGIHVRCSRGTCLSRQTKRA